MGAVWTWIERNRGLVVAALLSAAFLGWSFGCQPKANSPTTGNPVSAAELAADWDVWFANHQAEFDAMVARFRAADAEIERQATLWKAVWESAAPAIQAAAPAAAPAIATIGSLLAIGLGTDNIRKGWKIKEQRAELRQGGVA